jgi:hypothetical protein
MKEISKLKELLKEATSQDYEVNKVIKSLEENEVADTIEQTNPELAAIEKAQAVKKVQRYDAQEKDAEAKREQAQLNLRKKMITGESMEQPSTLVHDDSIVPVKKDEVTVIKFGSKHDSTDKEQLEPSVKAPDPAIDPGFDGPANDPKQVPTVQPVVNTIQPMMDMNNKEENNMEKKNMIIAIEESMKDLFKILKEEDSEEPMVGMMPPVVSPAAEAEMPAEEPSEMEEVKSEETVEVAADVQPEVTVTDTSIKIEIPVSGSEEVASEVSEESAEALKEAFRVVYGILSGKPLNEEESVEVPMDAEADVKVEKDKIVIEIPVGQKPIDEISQEQNEKLQEALSVISYILKEELGDAAAEPVHGSEKAKEHTPEVENKDILVGQHAEEVKEVVVEEVLQELKIFDNFKKGLNNYKLQRDAAKIAKLKTKSKLIKDRMSDTSAESEAIRASKNVGNQIRQAKTDAKVTRKVNAIDAKTRINNLKNEKNVESANTKLAKQISKTDKVLPQETGSTQTNLNASFDYNSLYLFSLSESDLDIFFNSLTEDEHLLVENFLDLLEGTEPHQEDQELNDKGELVDVEDKVLPVVKAGEVVIPAHDHADAEGKKVRDAIHEELGSAAAEPVHGSEKAKEHTPKVDNKDILVGQHAEEVEEVIVESEETVEVAADVKPEVMVSADSIRIEIPVDGKEVPSELSDEKMEQVQESLRRIHAIFSTRLNEEESVEVPMDAEAEVKVEGDVLVIEIPLEQPKEMVSSEEAEEVQSEVQKISESLLGSAAAEPVHSDEKAKEHTPKVSNKDILDGQHAEEVEEVIVESAKAKLMASKKKLVKKAEKPEVKGSYASVNSSFDFDTDAALYLLKEFKLPRAKKVQIVSETAAQFFVEDTRALIEASGFALTQAGFKKFLKEQKASLSEEEENHLFKEINGVKVSKEFNNSLGGSKSDLKAVIVESELGSAAAEPVHGTEKAKEHTPVVKAEDVIDSVQPAQEVKEVVVESETKLPEPSDAVENQYDIEAALKVSMNPVKDEKEEEIIANKAENKAQPEDVTETVSYKSLKEAFLLEADYFEKESFSKVSSEEKIEKLVEQVSLLVSRENKDPLYEELLKTTALAVKLQEELTSKYGKLANQKAAEILALKSGVTLEESKELVEFFLVLGNTNYDNLNEGLLSGLKTKILLFSVKFLSLNNLNKVINTAYTKAVGMVKTPEEKEKINSKFMPALQSKDKGEKVQFIRAMLKNAPAEKLEQAGQQVMAQSKKMSTQAPAQNQQVAESFDIKLIESMLREDPIQTALDAAEAAAAAGTATGNAVKIPDMTVGSLNAYVASKLAGLGPMFLGMSGPQAFLVGIIVGLIAVAVVYFVNKAIESKSDY